MISISMFVRMWKKLPWMTVAVNGVSMKGMTNPPTCPDRRSGMNPPCSASQPCCAEIRAKTHAELVAMAIQFVSGAPMRAGTIR